MRVVSLGVALPPFLLCRCSQTKDDMHRRMRVVAERLRGAPPLERSSSCGHLFAFGRLRPWELEGVPMPIVGGLDIHRKQITFDCVDTDTGELERGRMAPADRAHLADWLARQVADRAEVHLTFEGCTGWRYVAEELARAGVSAHLAEPADTAALRGRKATREDRPGRFAASAAAPQRRAAARARWIPPAHLLEDRALLETYRDLSSTPPGCSASTRCCSTRGPAAGAERAGSAVRRVKPSWPRSRPRNCLRSGNCRSPTALGMLTALDEYLETLRRQLINAARHLTGAKVLTARLNGVGPITALALTCWLGGQAGSPPHVGLCTRRARCHRPLLRRQTLSRAPVPARAGGAALVSV